MGRKWCILVEKCPDCAIKLINTLLALEKLSDTLFSLAGGDPGLSGSPCEGLAAEKGLE